MIQAWGTRDKGLKLSLGRERQDRTRPRIHFVESNEQRDFKMLISTPIHTPQGGSQVHTHQSEERIASHCAEGACLDAGRKVPLLGISRYGSLVTGNRGGARRRARSVGLSKVSHDRGGTEQRQNWERSACRPYNAWRWRYAAVIAAVQIVRVGVETPQLSGRAVDVDKAVLADGDVA